MFYVSCYWVSGLIVFLHDDAIAGHWFIVIKGLVSWLTIVSHMMYDFCTWLIVMSHGFHACDPLWTHDLLYELWLVLACCAVDSWESADGFYTMTCYESWVVWRESMSHGWGKKPYIRAPSWHEFGFFTQPSKLLSLLLIQSTIFISCQRSRPECLNR